MEGAEELDIKYSEDGKLVDFSNIYVNQDNTPVEDLKLNTYPIEIQELFMDFITNVPFIQNCISIDKPRACDMPRDLQGRIIIRIGEVHHLEDMDYFRPTAICFQKTGKCTPLRPNANPNSEFGRWFKEELRRCWDGYVRESDGEWVTGDMYFFLNYCPIMQSKVKQGSKKALRIWDFPEFWEGHYYKFHYANQAREAGLHGAELAARGRGKSYSLAAMVAKRFILGETLETNMEVKCLVTAYLKEYLNRDGVLNKFLSYIDFCKENTLFPGAKLKNSLNDMQWTSGYYDLDSNTRKGTKNEVLGVSSKDDDSKLRGKRAALIGIEEFGSFPNLLGLYGTLRPGMEEGDFAFGIIWLLGTAGDKDSDFHAAETLMYQPVGYHLYPVKNVYDKIGLGRKNFVYFFPGFINRKGCYDHDGNSDVTKAILQILIERYTVKHNAVDVNAISKAISEIPITPLEAIIKADGSLFPIAQLSERLNQIDNNPSEYDDVYVGSLVLEADGSVKYVPTSEVPIHIFPTKDNKLSGALEIFQMPEKNREGKIPPNRYIMAYDPVAADLADTMSLASVFVLDLFTDQLVAEYTGRLIYEDLNHEIVRLLCLFYNAKCMYENNIKGCYAYFAKMNCLHLLADTPDYLTDKQLVKVSGFGNTSKGIRATKPINAFGDQLIKDWLLKPVPKIVKDDEGNDKEISMPNLYNLRNRALIEEMIQYNPYINVDRIRALSSLMLYREEKMIMYLGNLSLQDDSYDAEYLGNDDFFNRNYNKTHKMLKYQ